MTLMSDEGPLIVYCRSWCPDCARARAWLQQHEIPYVEVDVDDDLDARTRAAGFNDGRLHTPTFERNGETCVDFRPERVKQLIGLEE
jgi:glutaredoxin